MKEPTGFDYISHKLVTLPCMISRESKLMAVLTRNADGFYQCRVGTVYLPDVVRDNDGGYAEACLEDAKQMVMRVGHVASFATARTFFKEHDVGLYTAPKEAYEGWL